jgi:hypothetical protein
MELTPETYLQHFGVKGMRWGQRKAEKNQERANLLLNTARAKPDTTIVELHDGSNVIKVITGREFVDHLMNGGIVDINRTRMFEPA